MILRMLGFRCSRVDRGYKRGLNSQCESPLRDPRIVMTTSEPQHLGVQGFRDYRDLSPLQTPNRMFILVSALEDSNQIANSTH